MTHCSSLVSAAHAFEDAGFDTCRFCGERKRHPDHSSPPAVRGTADEIERLRIALSEILDAVDDMRLVNRLKDIERIAIAALNAPEWQKDASNAR